MRRTQVHNAHPLRELGKLGTVPPDPEQIHTVPLPGHLRNEIAQKAVDPAASGGGEKDGDAARRTHNSFSARLPGSAPGNRLINLATLSSARLILTTLPKTHKGPTTPMLKEFRKRLRRKRRQRRADVHLISFPKCGRTWLVLLISKAIEKHFGIEGPDPLTPYRYTRKVRGLPYILPHHDGGPEFKRPEELETDKSFYAGKKVIFLVRDPRDVTVSSYYQKTKRNINYQGSLRDYVYEPVGSVETNIAFYNIWARNRHVPEDFLLVTYEDLQQDTGEQLRRVLDFLGLSGVSDATIADAVDFCRFDNMRELEANNTLGSKRLAPRDTGDEATYKTREGRIASYADHLEQGEIDHINRLIREQLDPLYDFYYEEPVAGLA